MKRILVCALLWCTYVSNLLAAEVRADLSVYVFENGLPLENLQLVISDDMMRRTNVNGTWHEKLQPGDYVLETHFGDGQVEKLNFSLLKRERKLIILIKPTSSQKVNVDIESSHSDSFPVELTDQGEEEIIDGPAGIIQGQVTSLESGAAVSKARIYLSGRRQAVLTDEEGRFKVRLRPGEYALSIVHPDYAAQTHKSLQVSDDGVVNRAVELTPAGVELEEFVVSAPALEGGFSALADEQRNTSAVAEVIGADQMSSSGDSDAAGALKRVTGLTVVDGKYIYVRGLGERYSSTTLNGMSLPSPDPTRRVVPLDLFPTGMLESVVVQKTYSPDVPGDFAGGTVQLRTRSIPDEKVRKISLSTGGNSLSTLKTGKTYTGGDWDVFGIDDGTREMPEVLDQMTDGGRDLLVLRSDADKERAGESLSKLYATKDQTLLPDVGFKLNYADRNEAYDAAWGWGYNVALNYKRKSRFREEEKYTYGLDGDGGLNRFDEVNRAKTEKEIDLGGMLNLALEVGNDHKMESTTILTRKTSDTVVIDEAYLSENDIDVLDTTLEWVERQLFSQQFNGTHVLPRFNDLEVYWYGSYSTARRYEPGSRTYRYEKDAAGEYAFSQDGQSNETSFEDLDDVSTNLGLDLTLPVYDFFSRQAKFKAGFNVLNKERESIYSRFRFLTDWSINDLSTDELYSSDPGTILSDDNIDAQGWVLRNTTLATDFYTANQSVFASYLKGDIVLSRKARIMAGARLEDARQEVSTAALISPEEKVSVEKQASDLLPASSFIYQLSDDQQLRLSYSQTINRPDLKELSPAEYMEPETRDRVVGNPDLKRASIKNYDMRWEKYLTRFEMFSVALFYKDFVSPIERTIRLGGGGLHTFDNAESAQSYGMEFQSRFWLSRYFGRKLSGFYLDGNFSLVESKVALGEAGAQQTNSQRPLQGQAPWVVNMTLAYENLISASKASLLFNVSGDHITSVGIKGLPDVYHEGAPQVDFVYSKLLREGYEDKLKGKLKIKNILDPKIKETVGGEISRAYRKGVSFTASLQYSWK